MTIIMSSELEKYISFFAHLDITFMHLISIVSISNSRKKKNHNEREEKRWQVSEKVSIS